MKKRLFAGALAALVLTLLAGLGGVAGVFWDWRTPVNSVAGPAVFTVPPGASAQQVARALQNQGFIRSEWAFLFLLYLEKARQALQAGEFEISASWDARKILSTLRYGKPVSYALTVPEGWDLFDIQAHLLKQDYIGDPEAFLAVARAPETLARLGIPAQSAEGYCFPETYQFTRGVGVREVLKAMVTLAFRKFREVQGGSTAAPDAWHRTLTLASLVEGETKIPQERTLVAAVYLNRIREAMLLQCDPTVIYAMKLEGRYQGNIGKADLKSDHPYNTYRRKGLPPGPICNPGRAAIQAAMHPAGVSYLYFVARKDGAHVFSTDYRAHVNAVNKHQKGEQPLVSSP